jgi:putative spermidine/putrescine transport system permease protein
VLPEPVNHRVVGGGLKTTLPKQMWDGILLQVNPIIAAASVVVLVILMFAIMECVQARSAAARRYS